MILLCLLRPFVQRKIENDVYVNLFKVLILYVRPKKQWCPLTCSYLVSCLIVNFIDTSLNKEQILDHHRINRSVFSSWIFYQSWDVHYQNSSSQDDQETITKSFWLDMSNSKLIKRRNRTEISMNISHQFHAWKWLTCHNSKCTFRWLIYFAFYILK